MNRTLIWLLILVSATTLALFTVAQPAASHQSPPGSPGASQPAPPNPPAAPPRSHPSVRVRALDTAGLDAGYGAYVADRIALNGAFRERVVTRRERGQTRGPRPDADLAGTVAKVSTGVEITILLTDARTAEVLLGHAYVGADVAATTTALLAGLDDFATAAETLAARAATTEATPDPTTRSPSAPVEPSASGTPSQPLTPDTTQATPPATTTPANAAAAATIPRWYPWPDPDPGRALCAAGRSLTFASADRALAHAEATARKTLLDQFPALVDAVVAAYADTRLKPHPAASARRTMAGAIARELAAKTTIAERRTLPAQPDGRVPAYALARLSVPDLSRALAGQLAAYAIRHEVEHVVDKTSLRSLIERFQRGEVLSAHAPDWARRRRENPGVTFVATAEVVGISNAASGLPAAARKATQALARRLQRALETTIRQTITRRAKRPLTLAEHTSYLLPPGIVTLAVAGVTVTNRFYKGGDEPESYAEVTVSFERAVAAAYAEYLRRYTMLRDPQAPQLTRDEIARGLRTFQR